MAALSGAFSLRGPSGQRNLLARVNKTNKPVVSAMVKTFAGSLAEKDRDEAHARWREVADNLRDRFRDVAELMDGEGVKRSIQWIDRSRTNMTSSPTWPSTRACARSWHSTNPLERVNKEIKRRTNVAGLGGQAVHRPARLSASLPNREAVVVRASRLTIGALMPERNDEWAVSRRYMPVEKLTAMYDDPNAATIIAAQ